MLRRDSTRDVTWTDECECECDPDVDPIVKTAIGSDGQYWTWAVTWDIVVLELKSEYEPIYGLVFHSKD